jgi:alcohol/geraniol dehydrogenase (NADP+)
VTDLFTGWAAHQPGGPLKPLQYDPGPLGPEEVQVRIAYCGLCLSDLAMIDNAWDATVFPIIPGHEIIGRVEALGAMAKVAAVGDLVGMGWFSAFCMGCKSCMSGRQNLCRRPEQTIVGRHGGFADRVRCHWSCVSVLPETVDPATAGPLFCGGLTVFSPLIELQVLPIHRVGVIGIGGLGHLAVKLLTRWGCHVTAFTQTASKANEAERMGAHSVVVFRNGSDLAAAEGGYHLLLATTPCQLDWSAFVRLLAPDGTLHFVGAVQEPLRIRADSLISRRKRVSGSPVGSPVEMSELLKFCGRHKIAPDVEQFAMSDINEAVDRLRHGQIRYRAVMIN